MLVRALQEANSQSSHPYISGRSAVPTRRESGLSTSLWITALALALAVLAFLNPKRSAIHDGNWHLHGTRMRRWEAGQWEYRELTPAELHELADRQLW
jgi:hypothetical protein